MVGEAILSKINSTTGQYEASDESEIDIFIAHFNGNCVPENKQNVEFYDQYKFLSIFESFPPSEILCLIEN